MDSKGIVGKYCKIYLWGAETSRFKRGKNTPFSLDFDSFKVKVGLQICYEIGFSEGARILSLQGTEILRSQKISFAGNSQIINPKDSVLKRAKKNNQVIIKTINLQECQIQRKEIPYLKDLNLALVESIKDTQWQKIF